MSLTSSLADSAIDIDMSPGYSSTHQDLTSRLSKLSHLLPKSPQLSTEQTKLLHYHISSLEIVLSLSSLPQPSSEEPATSIAPRAPAPLSAPPSAKSLLKPSTCAHLTVPAFLDSLTTLTTSLRTRQTESQNLHSISLLKISACTQRILELEERVQELESGNLEADDKSQLGAEKMDEWKSGDYTDDEFRGNIKSATRIVASSARAARLETLTRKARMRRSLGVGITGEEGTVDTSTEGMGHWKLIGKEDGKRLLLDGQDNDNNGYEDWDMTPTTTDIESWTKHWEKVEKGFSPKRENGRFRRRPDGIP